MLLMRVAFGRENWLDIKDSLSVYSSLLILKLSKGSSLKFLVVGKRLHRFKLNNFFNRSIDDLNLDFNKEVVLLFDELRKE